MREFIEEIDPEMLSPSFKQFLFEVQRGKGLKAYIFDQGHYLIAEEGTGHFSSEGINMKRLQTRSIF
ncbi:MAG: hypothetical protein IPK68_06120 [Bdellovibrionales bacterium]|nr:hypothetical protein [Bdellovibrionales bacterium]